LPSPSLFLPSLPPAFVVPPCLPFIGTFSPHFFSPRRRFPFWESWALALATFLLPPTSSFHPPSFHPPRSSPLAAAALTCLLPKYLVSSSCLRIALTSPSLPYSPTKPPHTTRPPAPPLPPPTAPPTPTPRPPMAPPPPTAPTGNKTGPPPTRARRTPKRPTRARSCRGWIACGRRRGMGGAKSGSGMRGGRGSGVRSRVLGV
jgi:hypothetical protein